MRLQACQPPKNTQHYTSHYLRHRALSRVGGADGLKRHEAKDRHAPPLIKPDGRFSRIRLSEGHSLALLLRHPPCPSCPRGQPIQAVVFPKDFPWIRFPQGWLAALLAPQPALQPAGRILVEPVKHPH